MRPRHLPLPIRWRSRWLSSTLRVLQLSKVFLKMVEHSVEAVYPERHHARRKLRLHITGGGGGVVDQHSLQAEVEEVVPPVVPGRTIGLHARLEGSIRVLLVSEEVTHRVYQTAGTPPEGSQLLGIGRDWQRHNSNEGWVSCG